MARADVITLLPLDTYARLMAINPNHFNQVTNPNAPPRVKECADTWLQHGWQDHSDRTMGREEIAQAIAAAEEAIAQTLGFWPAPRWVTNETRSWPRPKRGCQIATPPIQTAWGHVLAGGEEDTATMISAGVAIVYTDEDGDGSDDTATITVTAAEMTAAGASVGDVAIYYPDSYLGMPAYPVSERWRIRPLTIRTDSGTGDVVITGRRCQFVDPIGWAGNGLLDLTVDANFLTTVDVRRRYNNPTNSAQIIWKPGEASICSVSGVPACDRVCQDACIVVEDARLGYVKVLPASYAAGAWTYGSYSVCDYPAEVTLKYHCGWYRNLHNWMEADWMESMVAEAIVRLANVYMPDVPCGCALTRRKWDRDREEQEINVVDMARAMSNFGSTARGALFAWGVVKRMKPLSGAGAL